MNPKDPLTGLKMKNWDIVRIKDRNRLLNLYPNMMEEKRIEVVNSILKIPCSELKEVERELLFDLAKIREIMIYFKFKSREDYDKYKEENEDEKNSEIGFLRCTSISVTSSISKMPPVDFSKAP